MKPQKPHGCARILITHPNSTKQRAKRWLRDSGFDMARARNIKPGFFRNADLAELPVEARLLFIGLWTIADRAGRLEDRPKQIKMEIFPADSYDCDALLDMLASIGMVARYEFHGLRCIQVINFEKHQNPHRDERASTLPDHCGNISNTVHKQRQHHASTMQAPCDKAADSVGIGLNPESLFTDTLIPDSSTKHPVAKAPVELPGFARFWSAWPNSERKQAKGKCIESWKKAKAEKDVEAVLAHIESLKTSAAWTKNNGEFIPAPLVYLNNRRWEGVESMTQTSSVGFYR